MPGTCGNFSLKDGRESDLPDMSTWMFLFSLLNLVRALHWLHCFSDCLTLEIQVEIKSNWTTKSWRNFFRSTPPKLDRCFLSFSFSVWHNSDITFIQPAVAVSVWLMDFTLTCVQDGQLAQRASPWVGEISQLSVISWLMEDLKLQVLLLSYRADEDKALLPVSW